MGRWVVVLLVGVGCRQLLGIEELTAGAGGDGAPADAAAEGDGGSGADGALPVIDAPVFDGAPRDACGPIECDNCLDDDVDGRVDYDDPECTGPGDDDEGSYATKVPGDNTDPCTAECWFDLNGGAGDDGCQYDRTCDPLASSSPHYATCAGCGFSGAQIGPNCLGVCLPKQPNGCDCFGCCTVFLGSDSIDVVLEETCGYGLDLSDPTKCPLCVKTTECENPCEPCEHCLGRDPVGPCTAGDAGACATPCDPHEADACGDAGWCLTGCCVPAGP